MLVWKNEYYDVNMLHYSTLYVLPDKWCSQAGKKSALLRKYKSLCSAAGIFCNVDSINWSLSEAKKHPHNQHSSRSAWVPQCLYSNVYSYNLWSLTRIEKLKQYNTLLCSGRGSPSENARGKNDDLRANSNLRANDKCNKCKTPHCDVRITELWIWRFTQCMILAGAHP